MKLKEKFQNIPSTYLPLSNNQKNECVKITDKFAIEFGEWLMKKGRYNITSWSKTTKELLETFKQEKGL